MIKKLEKHIGTIKAGNVSYDAMKPASINKMHEKINELVDAINEIALRKECRAELLAKHDVFGEEQPALFTPEEMSEIRQKMKIPVVTDESAQNLLSENIELKAENVRLVQDLNRVCEQKFEELDVSVRQCNKDLFAENQKLKSALDRAMKTLTSYADKSLWNSRGYADCCENGYIYADLAIKDIKEITAMITKGGDNE